ncbi:endonuclease/exonuclease/phosphatase family protein [Kitasatospora sp. NPDC092286]|uniref:endonuclease/exonuclease/phosphatase family protein n=1 Tax=Kitasatospora sp. NPDC092286 TaxID=3364087 RepID=UPI00382A2EF5
MRVMAYNILDGGERRTEPLLAVIRAQRPDVLGLCECAGFDTGGTFEWFAEELGLVGVLNRAPSGNHVALLHRPELAVVRTSTQSAGMYNGMVEAVLRTGLGEVAFVMTHLHPFSPLFRLAEAETVAGAASFAPHSVVMGDLNSLSAAEHPDTHRALARTLRLRTTTADGRIDTGPADLLAARGWTDLDRGTPRPTYPTRIPIAEEAPGGAARLDYLFATPELAARCREFTVVDDDLAHLASDHLPVVAEFDLG